MPQQVKKGERLRSSADAPPGTRVWVWWPAEQTWFRGLAVGALAVRFPRKARAFPGPASLASGVSAPCRLFCAPPDARASRRRSPTRWRCSTTTASC